MIKENVVLNQVLANSIYMDVNVDFLEKISGYRSVGVFLSESLAHRTSAYHMRKKND